MRLLLGALLVALVITGAGCAPRQAAAVGSPASSGSASPPLSGPSPSPSAPSQSPQHSVGPWTWPTPEPPGGRRALAITSSDIAGAPTTVTLITIQGEHATSRTVISMAGLYVKDARGDLALITVDNDTQLALLNLQNGQIKRLPVVSPADVGGGRFSPDGSEAVVDVRNPDLSVELDIVTIRTGAIRPLLSIPQTAYHRAGLFLLRWAASGILVTPGVWDGLPSQVYNLNSGTGVLTLLTQSRVQATSPAGTMLAASNHVDLGDAQFEGQGAWPNQLVEGPIAGKQAVVVQQKNRAFYALDVADDSSLLYADDGDASTTKPAADMGLYLYRGGRSVKLASESWTGQWSARFEGADQALAIQSKTVTSGSLEIDLVGLCPMSATCTPALVPVLKLQGNLPVGYIVPVD